MPFGLPCKGSVCCVAHPRRTSVRLAVGAFHPLSLQGNEPHKKGLNRF